MAKHDQHLVVVTTVNVAKDPETDELVTDLTHEMNLQTDAEMAAMTELRAAGDTRLDNVRVFGLNVTKDGKPTIGTEVE